MAAEPKPYAPARWVRIRLCIAAGLVVALFAVLCQRAWVLQVREAEHLRAMAEEQYLKAVELPPKRGRILDAHGAELAASAEVDSVHVNARLVSASDRAGEIARLLTETLHLDRREVDKKLRSHRFFTWVKRRVPPDEARALRELALPGVYLDKEPRRYYPSRGLGGPLLGWAGLDAVGQEGIELEYDRFLRGARAQVPGLRDALGRAVLVAGLGDTSDVAGHDLYTTIDRYIQFRVERALEHAVTQHRAKAGVAVALDPRNGEVLAMASVPSLNPNEPEGARERGARNRAVTDPFEPGSTMKTFTLAAALEAKSTQPDEHWFCENGRYVIAGSTIHDAHSIGDVTTTGVLAKSSNIGMAKIAARTGRERVHEMLRRFGFGQRTGVDLPGERAGQIRRPERIGPVELATMAFGQGLTATSLQVAAGYAAIANGGVWHRPHVMRRVVDPSGATVSEAQDSSRRVIDEKLAATLRTMLFAVTQKGGTAAAFSLPGYTFAGKTGTAQKVDPVTRRYSPAYWASSFVGFAPADDPRLVLFVWVDEPADTHLGGAVAGPVFQEVMVDALRWLGVPPNAPAELAERDAREAAKEARDGRGEAAAKKAARPTAPAAQSRLEEAEPAALDDDDEGARATVPDFNGLSVGQALRVARRLGVRLQIVGSGRASAQTPTAGARLRARVCTVSFTPPT